MKRLKATPSFQKSTGLFGEKVATVPGVVDEKNLYAHDYETYHRNDK